MLLTENNNNPEIFYKSNKLRIKTKIKNNLLKTNVKINAGKSQSKIAKCVCIEVCSTTEGW